MEKEKPIGVFDSGIGGLTVVKKLLSTLPKESIVYFGDTARVPYGSKSNETVIEYSIQNTNFLLSKNGLINTEFILFSILTFIFFGLDRIISELNICDLFPKFKLIGILKSSSLISTFPVLIISISSN